MSIRNLQTDNSKIYCDLNVHNIEANEVNCAEELQTAEYRQKGALYTVDFNVTNVVEITTGVGRIHFTNVSALPATFWHTIIVEYADYIYPDSYVLISMNGQSAYQRQLYPSYWYNSTPGQFSVAFTNISTTTALITTLTCDYHIITTTDT